MGLNARNAPEELEGFRLRASSVLVAFAPPLADQGMKASDSNGWRRFDLIHDDGCPECRCLELPLDAWGRSERRESRDAVFGVVRNRESRTSDSCRVEGVGAQKRLVGRTGSE
jgi:hypothetical protein